MKEMLIFTPPENLVCTNGAVQGGVNQKEMLLAF